MAISVNNSRPKAGKVGVSASQLNAIITQRHDLGRGVWVVYITPDGWRLADFTTADDSYRPNLERIFDK